MNKRLLSVLIIPVLISFACNTGKKPVSEASVEVIEGIEYVYNTETPMYPEKTVSIVEDLSFCGEDKDGNIILFEPRLSLVDDNENIYFSEVKDHVIKVFDADGKYINPIGAKGQGPGEFQGISFLASNKDGIIIAIDDMTMRVSFFDSSGQFIKSFQMKTGYTSTILMKGSSIIFCEIILGKDYLSSRLCYVKEVDFEGKEVRSYGEFTPPERKIIRNGNSFGVMRLPVTLSSVFIGNQDREIFYHCLSNNYMIEVYDTSGKLFRKIDRPYKPVSFTKKDAEEYRAGYKTAPEVFRKAAESLEMPNVKNMVENMYVDDDSNLWIQTNETEEEEDQILTAFDIFNPDGHYYAKVWIPIIPQIFKKGKMYRMDIDKDTGYQTLKRYKVVWN